MMGFPFYKYGLIFRLVEESDAAFILSLRTNKVLSRHLSVTENNLQRQIAWIRDYKEREKDKKEYYVLYESPTHEPLGLVRIYGITTNSYVSGSWLIKPGCDELIGLKSDLFAGYLANEILKLGVCFFDVRKGNKKVLRYHKMFSEIIGEDEQNFYFSIDKKGYERKLAFLTSILQTDI